MRHEGEDLSLEAARARLEVGVLAPEERARIEREHDDAVYKLARKDINTFCEVVLKDEKTGQAVEQAPIHEQWHQLCDTHDQLVIWSHIESGKTSQLSIARPLWLIGRNPALRIAIISNTHDQASKIVRTIARYIEKSDELHRVFPGLRKGDPWMPSSTLFVDRPTSMAKDPSIQAFGVHGNITGSRVDVIILDDVLDFENIRTPRLRQELWDWYHNAVGGRLVEGGKIISIGVAQHPDDIQHRFARHGWANVRFPVIDDAGNYTWPDRWSPERVEAKRASTPPLEFARQLLCIARDEETALCKREWIDRCLDLGTRHKMSTSLKELPEGCVSYTGVDLAVQQHSAADLTSFFTILVDEHGNRRVLNIESGKLSGPEIVRRLIDVQRRFKSIVIVENNAAQDYIRQFSKHYAAELPVKGLVTGRNKAHPEFGIQGIFSELADGRWTVPCKGGYRHPEVDAWIADMMNYDPREHVGDRLMACWMAREGARLNAGKGKKLTVRVRSFGGRS